MTAKLGVRRGPLWPTPGGEADRDAERRQTTHGPGRYERRLLTKFSAMELPSPPSSGIRIQAHR